LRLSFFDGKALVIGDYSTDRDARDGYGIGKLHRGYKLHAWATEEGKIPCFAVHPLNVGEPNVARQLTERIPPGVWVLADANYDSAPLYAAVRQRRAHLLTPLKGATKSRRRLQQMEPSRRMILEWWQSMPAVCRMLLAFRPQIERIFSALTVFGGGLTTLPPWVRRLDRVRRWVAAKIAIYHARLKCRRAAS
jgi:hypothetical protein